MKERNAKRGQNNNQGVDGKKAEIDFHSSEVEEKFSYRPDDVNRNKIKKKEEAEHDVNTAGLLFFNLPEGLLHN